VRSYNLNVFGEKLWILIDLNHTSEFEEALVIWLSDGGSCDQFVRHCNLLIMPARLRKEGIEFELICAGLGDMVLTKPRRYHAVINLSAFQIQYSTSRQQPSAPKLSNLHHLDKQLS